MQNRSIVAAVVAAPLCVCAPAGAQAFNIDFGFQTGIPGLGFSAASSQGGIWTIPTTDGNVIDFPSFFDNTFTPTDVYFRSSRALTWAGNPGLAGPESLIGLVADGVLLGGPSLRGDRNGRDEPAGGPGFGPSSGPVTLTFEGIENGLYEVYTYAWSPIDFTALTEITIAGDRRSAGGEFPAGFFIEGITHTRHEVSIHDGVLAIRAESLNGEGMLTGIQIVPVPAPGATACALGGMLVLGPRRRRPPA